MVVSYGKEASCSVVPCCFCMAVSLHLGSLCGRGLLPRGHHSLRVKDGGSRSVREGQAARERWRIWVVGKGQTSCDAAPHAAAVWLRHTAHR